MTISTGHFELMEISSVELKTRLGHYLRTVEQTGEAIDVSVRGRAVATLLPHSSATKQSAREGDATTALNQALQRGGLRVEAARRPPQKATVKPHRAGDGRDDIDTVEAMRSSKNW